MKKYVKKILYLLLTCILLAGMLPMTAMADAGNFTINMPTDIKAEMGDSISIPVVVKHTAGVDTYNSFDMSFTYDHSVLELTSTSIAGMSVTGSNGLVRVLRYGSDLPVGELAFTLTFKAIKSGDTSIKVSKAKVGIRETAQDEDASAAFIPHDVNVEIGGKYKITVDANNGGTVSVSPKEAAAGEKIEIKVTPNSGYRMKTLTVTDAEGKNVAVSTDNNGKYSFVMPNSNVTVKVTFTAKSTASSDSSNPQTGDDFNLAAWNTIALTSLLALAVVVLNKKKFYQM